MVTQMKALITGASSGMGADFARQLAAKGYDLILVARREDRLQKLAEETEALGVKARVLAFDLTEKENCLKLFDAVCDEDIDILINNAGFGLLGTFRENDLDRELSMIDLNVKAMHILMKLFLCKFCERGCGKILNVASVGGFMPGPLLSTYYATKAYVVSLTSAVREEVRRAGFGKDIYVGCLCPGPVDTEFSSVANVSFSLKGKPSEKVVRYAIKKMFRGKGIIVPGLDIKCAVLASKLAPESLSAKITYNVQKKKTNK